VFVEQENIVCTLNWSSVIAKNEENLHFMKKKVWWDSINAVNPIKT
jgi:hypothetical protein